jgi:hypothetical protein
MQVTCPKCGFQADIRDHRSLAEGKLMVALAQKCQEGAASQLLGGRMGGPVSGCSIFDSATLTALNRGVLPT